MQTSPKYEEDFLLWSIDQMEKYRSGQIDQLDLSNIMQEIDDMGKEQKIALQSLMRNLLVHLLKLNYSPAEQPRAKWIGEIAEFRAQIETRVEQTPSLSHYQNELYDKAWSQARKIAAQQFEAYSENVELPTENPYTIENAFDGEFLPSFASHTSHAPK